MNSNNQRIKNGFEISLKDFPNDIYVLLEDEFRAKFFKTAWKINRSYRHLAAKMGVSNTVMLSLRRGKDPAGLDKYLSVKHLNKIIKLSETSPLWNLSFGDIQKNIKSVKAKHGKHKIYNMILPIYDSIYLREVVTHLLCDGCALNETHRLSKYSLVNREAVEEFKKELSIFGSQPTLNITVEKHGDFKSAYVLSFSKAITKILLNKLDISFRGTEARLPTCFLDGEKKLLVAIIRAFLIDEGCIKDRNINFCSGSLGLLEDLRKVCNKLGYQCQKIKGSGAYYLDISPNSFKEVYNDIMEIGPLPIKEKQELLDLGLKIMENKQDFRTLNKKILFLLKNKPHTTLELAKILLVNRKTICCRLLRLKQQNLVKKFDRRNKGKGASFTWIIND